MHGVSVGPSHTSSGNGRVTTAWLQALTAEGLDPWLDHEGHCWIRYHHICRVRAPSSVLTPLNGADRRSLLYGQRACVIGHCHLPRPEEHPNAYLYVCRIAGYDFEALSANTRSKIRRGLRRHELRPVDERTVAEQGYECHADSRRRNELTPMTQPAFHRYWSQLPSSRFRRIWGAFHGGEMVAFLALQHCENWADNCLLAARTNRLRDYPTNALCFHVLRELLSGPAPVQGVSFGLSSLQPDSHVNTLHTYKLSLGFEAIPIVRVLEIHPLLRPFIKSPVRGVIRIAQRLAPHSRSVRKARGLLEFLLTGVLPMPEGESVPLSAAPIRMEGSPAQASAV